MTSGDLSFDLTQTMAWASISVMILDALSNAAYRVSLRGPGAKLDGASKHPWPGAVGAEHMADEVKWVHE